MIKLRQEDRLLLCSLEITINEQVLNLNNVLVDTGSATTLINSDYIETDGTEIIDTIYGVGGYETILNKQVDVFNINGLIIENFKIDLGNMDFGITLDGILGLDALTILGANINIKDSILSFENTINS
ncbi:aspartyl protease family protein [Clostridium sp.]|uniref:aspartyl protease family protein n=1 Tax=Clostridium sp. TaxID=1506 RepID=UPI002849F8A4|nr:aspartyl protease family protein [Clostridium sp.]MDR3593215.1 aspartyl protease family protein [Clostridium sp.]